MLVVVLSRMKERRSAVGKRCKTGLSRVMRSMPMNIDRSHSSRAKLSSGRCPRTVTASFSGGIRGESPTWRTRPEAALIGRNRDTNPDPPEPLWGCEDS